MVGSWVKDWESLREKRTPWMKMEGRGECRKENPLIAQ